MAARKAGVIVIEIDARTGKLNDNLNQGSARLGKFGSEGRAAVLPLSSSVLQLNSNIAALNATLNRAAVNHQLAAGAAERNAIAHGKGSRAAKEGHESYFKLGEEVLLLHRGYELLSGSIARYSSMAVRSAGTSDQIANAYRGIRFALSPTPFTLATIAAGILAEETIKLVMARAKLIDQQSLFAAANHVSFQSVDMLDTTSKISGSNAGNVRSLFTGLQAQWSSNQAAVQGALDKLGATANVGDARVLGQIAEGFHAIQDPAEQAKVAVQLFGSQAGVALQELNGRFANSAEAVRNFGMGLDKLSRTQIHQFRQDILDLKNTLTDFSNAKAWWESFKTGTEIVAAAAEDMSKRGIDALDRLIGSYLPGVTTLRGALTSLVPGVAILTGLYGAAPIPKAEPPKPPTPGGSGRVEQGMVADQMMAEAEAAKRRQSETLEGQRAARDAASARSKAAFDTLEADRKARADNPQSANLLTPQARFNLSTEMQSAGAVAAAKSRSITAIEDAKKAADAAEKAAEQIAKVMQKRFAGVTEHLAEAVDTLAAAGKPKEEQLRLREESSGRKAVAGENQRLKEVGGGPLSAADAAKIQSMEAAAEEKKAEAAWRNELKATTDAIQQKIHVQLLLNDAVGKGYEKAKAAAVESELMQKFGEDYTNPKRQAEIGVVRGQMSAEHDTKQLGSVLAEIDKLGDQIELQKALAAAQRQGAEAVRLAEFAFKLDQIAKNNDAESTKKLTAAEKELYTASEANRSSETLARIEDETAALKRLTAAAIGGAEAIRKAQMANQFAALGKQGGTPIPGMVGVTREQVATAGLDQGKHENQVADEAMKRVNVYKDQLITLNQQLDVLKDYRSKDQDNLQVAIAIRDIENEKLRILAEEALATGKLGDGLKAVFLEAAANAEKPGQILHDGLNHAVDGVSDELSKLMTGQKTNWGKMMQGLGQGIVKDELKSGMLQGIGALGKKLGIPGLEGHSKKDQPVTFRSGDAGHVIVDNMPGGVAGKPSGAASGAGIASSLAGSVGEDSAAVEPKGTSSSIFTPAGPDFVPMAASGPAPPAAAAGESGSAPAGRAAGGAGGGGGAGRMKETAGAISSLVHGSTAPMAGILAKLLVTHQQRQMLDKLLAKQILARSHGHAPIRPLKGGGPGSFDAAAMYGGASPSPGSGIGDTLGPAAGAAAGAGIGAGIGAGVASSAAPAATSVTSTFAAAAADFIPMASGGPASPDTAYWVGEHGPEPFVPKTSGTIIPNHKVGGGGDTHVSYTIDARNADIGAAGRLKQLMEVHQSAVKQSVSASAERQQRTPSRTK